MKGFGDQLKSNKNINNKTNPSKEKIINQAFKFHSEGNISGAAKYYQYFINQGFKDHRVFSNYGIILKDLGKSHEAEISYRKAIELNPYFAEAHSNLGNLLRDLRKPQQAEISTRKAIELNPHFSEAHSNLGNVLKDLGKLQEAEKSYRKAIKLNPHFADSHYKLGNLLRDLGKLKEAEISTRKAIELNPHFAEAHANLGSLLKELGKLKEAEIFTRKAIELNPHLAEAHTNLGNLLKENGKSKEAEILYRRAIEINPRLAIAHNNLGIVLSDLDKSKEVELSFRKSIELNPLYIEAYFNLLLYYEETNSLIKLKEAINEFGDVKQLKDELIIFKARMNFREGEYSAAKRIIDRISSESTNKNSTIKETTFWSYKAFIEDKVGNYDLAYSCFKKSQNDSSYMRLNKDIYLNIIDSYKKNVINKTVVFNKYNDGIEDTNIAFLIGFPRSGTTLLDTILRSHQNIQVIEEKPLISNIEKYAIKDLRMKTDNLYSLSKENIIILRKKYFKLLDKYKTKETTLLIDKLPLHTIRLPLINLLFPNAKIIFTHRHPYDTVLSCFQQSFKPNEAMANLTNLKSSSIMYDKVMGAWDIYKTNLPLDFITSKYEHLIEDFDDHTLKILDFLGVGWDENVKNYRKTALERGKINTPSSSQVVQPLYKSSIEKWKNYEKYFEDCHQYLEKWVSYFDY